MPVHPPVTLWERVEQFLKNQTWAVVILLGVVILGGVKSTIEGVQAVMAAINTWIRDRPEESKVMECSALGHVKSGSAAPPEQMRVYVSNTYDPSPVKLTWIDADGVLADGSAGRPRVVVDVSHGQQGYTDTFPSHVWVLADGNNSCLGIIKFGTRPVIIDVVGNKMAFRYLSSLEGGATLTSSAAAPGR